MSRFSPQTQGILWMMFTGFLNVAIYAVMHYIGTRFHFHPFQIFFFYCLMGSLFYLPVGIGTVHRIERGSFKFYAIRSVLEFVAFTLMISALDRLPLPMQTALGFTSPIFGSLAAVYFLGEANSVHRWLSLGMGFLGVLIIQLPSFMAAGDQAGSFNIGAFYVLAASIGFALTGICIKKLTRTEPPKRIAFYMLAMTALFSLPFAVWKWQPVPNEAWAIIAGLGLLVAIVQFTVGLAYSKADVTTILPFNFLNLIWSALFSFLIFGEMINGWTIAGGGVIMMGAIYGITHASRTNVKATLRAAAGGS